MYIVQCIYRISWIRRCGYYLFHCLFCAATIRGRRLFLWKARRHQRRLGKETAAHEHVYCQLSVVGSRYPRSHCMCIRVFVLTLRSRSSHCYCHCFSSTLLKLPLVPLSSLFSASFHTFFALGTHTCTCTCMGGGRTHI